MNKRFLFNTLTGVASVAILAGCATKSSTPADPNTVQISVSPKVARVIGGETELNRNVYFNLSDAGDGFKQRCRSDERYEYLKEHQITFGRQLGPVQAVVNWSDYVREDANRPGHVDLEYFKEKAQAGVRPPDPGFEADYGKLEVATHGQPNGYPEYMGRYNTEHTLKEHHPKSLPTNYVAAAELAAYTMKYNYTDFTRPLYFEPINEPHWSFFDGDELAEWHLATMEKVHEIAPGVKVGGPCQSVSYMYVHDYGTFRGWTKFLDKTDGKMDFYSFHCYDYFGEKDGDFGGRITSGLPLESVLDMIPNYTQLKFDRTYDIVISEHGGYELNEGKYTRELARKHIPGEGFEWEMKQRSIADYNAVTTFIANTLCFMNHPHTVKKAVPFILLESMNWDPKYYATLYAPRNYTDKDDWVAGRLIDFYKVFKGVQGRFVQIDNVDPDIQTMAVVDGSKLFVILNNLAKKPAPLALDVKKAKKMEVRRYGRNDDFTPYLIEEELKSLAGLTLGKRETMVLVLDYKKTVKTKSIINEVACYSDKVAVSVPAEGQEFAINVPQDKEIDYAQLRVGFVRPFDAPIEVKIMLNGEELVVPMEDCAARLSEEGKEYATTKLISLDPEKLLAANTVKVVFPDGGKASVGAAVIRIGQKD